MSCENPAPGFPLVYNIEQKRAFVTQISYDLVNSQMNAETINKQMDFKEIELPFFYFMPNIIFLLLVFFFSMQYENTTENFL